MSIEPLPRLTSLGLELDASPDALGALRDSSALAEDAPALRQRMREDGYFYLPQYLDRDEVLAVRHVIAQRLASQGCLDESFPVDEAVAQPDVHFAFRPDLALENPALHRLLYAGRMMELHTRFLGGAVRHFDYTWLRAVAPGMGTAPHSDIVAMGRGTTNLFTAWTPLGDISTSMGGLMILEKSHCHERLNANYGRKDVDVFCSNRRVANFGDLGGGGNIQSGGALSKNPLKLRERLGGRWLTNEFRAGDVVIFGMFTIHGSLDNGSNRIRLSSDSRYQLASEPADERWIGPNPIAHGPQAKQGMIC